MDGGELLSDESAQRDVICRLARDLWLRGFIAGDGGMFTCECHRRRYLATPPGKRRASLTPPDLLLVDSGGVDLRTEHPLDQSVWKPHRLAYALARNERDAAEAPGSIAATLLCTPPCIAAWHNLHPGDLILEFASGSALTVAAVENDTRFAEALRRDGAVLIPQLGLLTTGPTPDIAANTAERLEQYAAVDLATRRMETA